jgi:hypothetical protein
MLLKIKLFSMASIIFQLRRTFIALGVECQIKQGVLVVPQAKGLPPVIIAPGADINHIFLIMDKSMRAYGGQDDRRVHVSCASWRHRYCFAWVSSIDLVLKLVNHDIIELKPVRVA